MVNVNGAGGNETVTYDTTDGNYEPGATPEGVGISEIEFNFSMCGGTDTLAPAVSWSTRTTTLTTARTKATTSARTSNRSPARAATTRSTTAVRL
jgi:hypothetical protein